MSAMSDALENALIDWFFRGQASGLAGASAAAGSGPANLYVGLVTAAENDAAAGIEVAGGSYARVAVPSSLANWAGTQGAGTTTASTGSSGTTSNNIAITFPPPTANWGVVVGFGIWDSATGGKLLFYGALNINKTINNGDAAPSFAAGQLSIQIDN